MSGKTLIVAGAVVGVAGLAAALGVLVLSDSPEGEGDGSLEVTSEGELAAEGGETDDGGAEAERERELEPVPAARPADGALWVPIDDLPEPVLAVDWDALGTSLAELVPILADVANLATRGGAIDDAASQRASDLRAAVDDALGLLDQHLPSVFPTDTLSHPAVAANLIAATLHARSMGLSDEQLEALRERAQRAHDAENEAVAQESEHAWRLTRAVAMFERRTAFFAEFEELLTKRQRRGLHAEIARGRVRIDPFSAAVIWDASVDVMLVTDDESMVVAAGSSLLRSMGFDEDRYEQGMGIVRERIADVPREWLGKKGDWMGALGFLPGERAAEWAAWSVDVLLEVLAAVSRGRLPAAPPDVLDTPVALIWDPEF